jgi:hypothetical protein
MWVAGSSPAMKDCYFCNLRDAYKAKPPTQAAGGPDAGDATPQPPSFFRSPFLRSRNSRPTFTIGTPA